MISMLKYVEKINSITQVMPRDDTHLYFLYFLQLNWCQILTGSKMSVIQAQVDYNDGGMLKV